MLILFRWESGGVGMLIGDDNDYLCALCLFSADRHSDQMAGRIIAEQQNGTLTLYPNGHKLIAAW